MHDSALASTLPQPTLLNPCREVTSLIPVFPPLDTQLGSIVETTNATKDSANKLLITLQGNTFLTDIAAMNLTSDKLQGLPDRNVPDNLTMNELDDITASDHIDISVYIVFVKQALAEQYTYDRGILANKLKKVQTDLFALLCKVNVLLRSRNVAIPSFAEASAMPNDIKNISDATDRYSRNFVMINNAKTFLEALLTTYSTFKELNKA
ncbi:hypothetical protein PoB_003828100 [Plakobranchus ocellatus]|uniref:Uncharacterized protein n=1 Tax=Plakobranchus ocellatus TaxID=259542 RepID=A0AAV4AZ21_9GAST|nr:hypothetical protein PoB_003828100 [Plakobranchus ocellatus]